MTFPFDPHQGLIVVSARVDGPGGSMVVRLALDTGATDSTINADLLRMIGYDPALASTVVEVSTGSGVERVPVVTVAKLTGFGQDRTAFPLLGLTLPPSVGVDGILGLDFLRGHRLTIDFLSGQFSL